MTPGRKIAEALLHMDWQRIVLEISGRRRIKLTTLAQYANTKPDTLHRITSGRVKDGPRIKLAIRLLDMHAEAMAMERRE